MITILVVATALDCLGNRERKSNDRDSYQLH